MSLPSLPSLPSSLFVAAESTQRGKGQAINLRAAKVGPSGTSTRTWLLARRVGFIIIIIIIIIIISGSMDDTVLLKYKYSSIIDAPTPSSKPPG